MLRMCTGAWGCGRAPSSWWRCLEGGLRCSRGELLGSFVRDVCRGLILRWFARNGGAVLGIDLEKTLEFFGVGCFEGILQLAPETCELTFGPGIEIIGPIIVGTNIL